MSSYPSCLQDGRFLLNFFICHPSDSCVNTINKLYWLQYHTLSKLQSPLTMTNTHLICPSDTSVNYAQHHKLCPFRKRLNLTHLDTFIQDPFEFASVHGWKTWDWVSQAGWDILKLHLDMFHHQLPRFDIPLYSIHVDRGAHVQFHNGALTCQLVLAASHAIDSPGTLTCQWQKVIASEQTTPIFFFWIYHDNGASSEVWHAEVDYLNVHFAGESEKWERMEHYDKSLAFWLHFWSLPSLWLGAPHQVFLGCLREWDSLLLGGTVQPSSDLRPTTTRASFQEIRSSSISGSIS